MTKVVIDAGHGLNTSGKRCLKSLDKAETREWSLNDRIADNLEKLLKDYNVEVLRSDDTTGKKDVSLNERVKLANDNKANLFISIHHNAGINGGNGGGTVVYYYKNSDVESAKRLYNNVVSNTKLVGNRATKVSYGNFQVIRETKMSALLIENGFMDSRVDVPIILTDSHANLTANGICKYIVDELQLTRKAIPSTKSTFNVGDLVTINDGSTYYNSTKLVPAWVCKDKWVISSISGDRAVLGKNALGDNSLNSALNVKDLKLASANTSVKASYYPQYTGKKVAIVDILKEMGIDNSFNFRAKLAKANGISGVFLGLPSQNSKLASLAKLGRLKRV